MHYQNNANKYKNDVNGIDNSFLYCTRITLLISCTFSSSLVPNATFLLFYKSTFFVFQILTLKKNINSVLFGLFVTVHQDIDGFIYFKK
jgi:hypothetical protein